VRLALDGSVACTAPPVSFHTSQLSMVPRATSSDLPISASSHAALVPEK
jgi:hypothetical protein